MALEAEDQRYPVRGLTRCLILHVRMFFGQHVGEELFGERRRVPRQWALSLIFA